MNQTRRLTWLSALAGLLLSALIAPGHVAADDEGAAAAAPTSRASLERVERASPSTTFTGVSGLIRVPEAGVIPEGDVRLSVTPAPSGGESPMPGGASNDAITLGIARNTELSISLGEARFGHDITVHGKIDLARETDNRPGVSVGVLDLRRTNLDLGPTYFAVASKHFAGGRGEATLGMAAGEHSGVLAGLSLRPVPWLELQGEYDTDRLNYGAALLLGDRFAARVANVDVGTAYTFSYQFPVAFPGAPAKPALGADLGPGTAEGERACTSLVQEELVRMGLENVQAEIRPLGSQRTLCVAFDNRRYTLNDYDAVAAVLPVAARLADPDVEQVVVRVQKRGLATADLVCPLEDYRQYARGEMTAREFASRVKVERMPGMHHTDVTTSPTGVANPPWLRMDLTLAPGLVTEAATETATLLTGWSLEPGAQVLLWKGLEAQARWRVPVAGPLVADRRGDVITDEALLAYAIRPGRGFIIQGLGGRFSDRTFQHWDGYGAEVAVPVGENGLFHATAVRLDNEELGTTNYAIADFWYQVPDSPLQVRVLGGQFLYEDQGWGVDLIRYDRELELALGVRHTGANDVMEVRVSFPLSPRRQPQAPGRVRARLADYWPYNSRSLLAERNYVFLAQRTGKELSIGPNLVSSFFNRNRLSAGGFMVYLQDRK